MAQASTARGSRLIPVSFGRDPGLVAHVELQQHGGEGLDRRGVRQLAGVERPAAGDLGDDLADRARPRPGRRRRSARRSRSARRGARAPWPAGGGRRRRPGSSGTAACTWAATLPRGGTSGWNSWPTRTSALAMLTTTLPRSSVARAPAPSSPPSPTAWRSRRGRSRRRPALSPYAEQLGRARATCSTSSSRASIARYFDREPITTVVADARQPGGQARCPPGRAAQDPDAHDARSLAHRPRSLRPKGGYGRRAWVCSTARTS